MAYTFITSDQKRQAGDIIKAFELTGTPVPAEISQLWNNFVEEMKAVLLTALLYIPRISRHALLSENLLMFWLFIRRVRQ